MSIRPLIILVYYILAINNNHLQAQSYSFVHYDTKDGLPSTTVYDITQDKNGFIWFATENGLCRFDGRNFKTFTTKDGLPDNSILRVHGDNSGRVYFTPFTHSLYYYQNDSFFKFPIKDKYKLDLSIVSMFWNKKDKVLLAGLRNTYVLENDSLVSFWDKYKTNFFIHAAFDTLIAGVANDSLFFIYDSGKIISSRKPTDRLLFDENAKIRTLNSTEKLSYFTMEYLTDSLAYTHTNNILEIFRTLTGSSLHKIRVNKFSHAFMDNENNLWISTLGNGVYRLPSFGFRNIEFTGEKEIFSLSKFNGQILAGTDFSNIYSLPVQNIDSTYTTINLSKFILPSGNPISKLTKRNRIYVMHPYKGNLYVGADGFLLKKNRLSAPIFRNIYPIKDIDISGKDLLICTGVNALLLDEQDIRIKDTLLKQRSTCGIIYRGDYYIGTLGGLIKIDSKTKIKTELYTLMPSFKGRITAIKRGIHDDLWVATSGSGLIHFKNDSIIGGFKEQDGLTSDICTSLFIDSNLIWLGTNKGLNRIETGKEVNAITRFTSANGLGANFINAVLATDSNVYVGTSEGLTTFSKNTLTEKSICILYILNISENNTRLKKDSSYSFPYNAINIQIDFTAISFKSAGDITYYYQLKGLDQNWIATTANFINFPTLQPANYTLYLKAINKFGVESNIRTIRITIFPPWWQTWPFRIAVLLTLGLLVLIIYRYNIRGIRRKEEMKREFEARFSALEQQALQAQMNPHFIFNALNSIQTFILNLDAEGANNYLTNFANLIRQTLENSMQPLITLESEAKYLETYLSLEKLRFRDKFEYKIYIDENIDLNNTLLPGMLLQPYIENAIRHGIQHRPDNKGLISLTISKDQDGSVIYTVKDNGVGRKKAEELKSQRHIEYHSRGISINEKRIAAINNQYKANIKVKIDDINDENGILSGTSVMLRIPPFHK